MKYYAVTNDPTELMHFGVKGMKWGVIRTDAQLGHPSKPRSAAYKKASQKLGKMMKSGIKKAEAHWQEYNSPQNKAIRAENKADRQYARAIKKADKRFEKHLQLARQGRLKYKGISDAEVERITDRLDLERSARQLSGTEKQGFIRRAKTAVGEGVIKGIEVGTAASIGEWASRKSKLKTQRLSNEQQRLFDIEKEQRQLANNRAKEEYNFELAKRKDAYETKRDADRQRRKDDYEHERDARYERERVKNAALYGAQYDKDGKLLYDSSGFNAKDYYDKKYDPRGAAKEQKRQNRETARQTREQARSQRQQQKQSENEAYRIRREEERKRARDNAYELSKTRKQLADEDRINKWNAQYDRDQERRAARDAARVERIQKREAEKARIARQNELSTQRRRRSDKYYTTSATDQARENRRRRSGKGA